MYYVYILKNERTGTFYKGYAENLRRRLREHLDKRVKTTSTGDYNLVFYCAFQEKIQAEKFEKYLKHGSGFAFAKKHFLK